MNERLTLQDLIDILAEKRNITKKDAETFLRELVALISETISNKDFVRIKDLGTLKLVAVSARKSVDVNTGEPIEISPHYKLSFTPDKVLRELVNRPFSHFESVLLNEDVDFEDLKAMNDSVSSRQEGDDDDDDVRVSATTTTATANERLAPKAVIEEPKFEELQKVETTKQVAVANVKIEEEQVDVNFDELDSLPAETVLVEEQSIVEEEIILVDAATAPVIQHIQSAKNSIVVSDEELDNKVKSVEPTTVNIVTEDVNRVVAESAQPKVEAVALKVEPTEEPVKSSRRPAPAYSDDEIYDFLEDAKKAKKRNMFLLIACACILVFGSVGYWVYNTMSDTTVPSDTYVAQNNDQITIIDDEPANNATTNEDSTSNTGRATATTATNEDNQSGANIKTDVATNTTTADAPVKPVSETPKANVTSVTKEKSKVVVLEKGESMRMLGKKHYGNPVFWVYIFEENSGKIKNPDAIYAGMEMVIPPASKYGIDPKNKESIAKAKKEENRLYAKFAK